MNSVDGSDPNWTWYRSFLEVLDSGSLSAAARGLGLTQPTVGRHIESLEGTLGLKLFVRSFDGFAPTEAALALQPFARSMASSAAALRRMASSQGEGVRGTVRLSASEVMGVEVLPPLLVALRRDYPELSIELVLSSRADDLLRREADIAIRMFRPVQHALVAQRVGDIELGLYAHEDYLRGHPEPRTLGELAHHSVIGFDRETAYIRSVQQRFPGFTRELLSFRADNDLAQLAALRAGWGIGVSYVTLAQRQPQLQRVLCKDFSLMLDTWVVMHEDLRDSPRCAVCFAALAQGLRAYVRGASTDRA